MKLSRPRQRPARKSDKPFASRRLSRLSTRLGVNPADPFARRMPAEAPAAPAAPAAPLPFPTRSDAPPFEVHAGDAPPGLFPSMLDQLLDAGLDAMLRRDLDDAWRLFSAANRLAPNNPTIIANLKRLQALGVGASTR